VVTWVRRPIHDFCFEHSWATACSDKVNSLIPMETIEHLVKTNKLRRPREKPKTDVL